MSVTAPAHGVWASKRSRSRSLAPSQRDDRDRTGVAGPSSGSQVLEQRRGPGVRVLLVEDNPGDADLVRGAFAQANAEVNLVHVERISEAIKQVAEREFDLALIDLSLPDAVELSGVGRLRMAFPSLPIVILTSLDDERLAAKAVAEGAQDYLVKGDIPAPLLMRAVRYAIERQQYADRSRALAEERATRVAAEALATENARLYQEAQRALGARDEFLAIASHELRAPLTAIHLNLEAIRKKVDAAAAGDILRKIDVALRSSRRLTTLTETLLDVSRITAARFTIRKEAFDAGGLVRDAIEQFRDNAVAAGCEVSLRADAPIVGCWDKMRFEQAVTNLLSNAIRYAPGGPIEVSIHEELEDLVLMVSDHGPGIPEPDLARIFERFERATTAHHHQGGLGLGLYVAREIAIAHGGRLEAENLPTRGARFTLRLPLETPPPTQVDGEA
ncbi:MAG TPA: ATP-binding protein [Anaeromyxobacteraceae bacterium]